MNLSTYMNQLNVCSVYKNFRHANATLAIVVEQKEILIK